DGGRGRGTDRLPPLRAGGGRGGGRGGPHPGARRPRRRPLARRPRARGPPAARARVLRRRRPRRQAGRGRLMPTATIDGIETHYEVLGDGPPLLLLSPGGFNATIDNWRSFGIYARLALLDHLRERFACIVFDK